jgi:hypothetical protein
MSEMSWAAWVIVLAVLTGVFALVLATFEVGKPARDMARASLWLSIAIVPVSIAGPLTGAGARAVSTPGATQLGEVISTAMSSGVVALMCAALASVALKKANAARLR